MGTIQAGQTIETVRINELTTNDVQLNNSDKLPIYVSSTNKTRNIALSALRTFLINGSNQTIAPQPIGSSIVVTAGAAENGTNIFHVPAIAGQTFILRRNFVGILDIGIDYDILSTGGFVLLGVDDLINLNEKFEIQLAVPTVSVNSNISSTIFTGELSVSSNTILNQSSHLKKLIRVRPTAAGLVVSLPKVDEYPENEILVIESIINAPYESTIQTQSGQNIYFNGQSYQKINIRAGESFMVQRASSGWFVLWASPSIYKVGELSFGYKLMPNEIMPIGQELSRVTYKRLWEWVESLSDSLVDDTTWLTEEVTVAGRTVAYPYRGCFSSGDGTSTFRLPDWSNSAPRVLNNIGGTDTERHYNKAGGFQGDEIKSHNHEINYGMNGTDGTANAQTIRQSGADNSEGNGVGKNTYAIDSFGGSETRMKNIGVIAKLCI